jgi:hypothetical protein
VWIDVELQVGLVVYGYGIAVRQMNNTARVEFLSMDVSRSPNGVGGEDLESHECDRELE